MTRQCELLDLLYYADDEFLRFVVKQGGYGEVRRMPVEEHHIIHGTSRRDRKANLILLSLPIHHFWIHEHSGKGLVACLYRQQQLGRLDWNVLDEIIGGRPGRAKGMIQQPLTGCYEKWRRELLS